MPEPAPPIEGACYPRPVDRGTLARHLEETEEHITLSEQHFAEQRALVGRLQRDGYDATAAKALLEQLEESRALHIADRDRLLRILKELGE